uniref:Transmembrane protein n=1 Tax=Arabidopsis thaliana TaxID=3702 RepID=Q1PF80_ARATH|nr:unknown [Arabidopsis thaliana]
MWINLVYVHEFVLFTSLLNCISLQIADSTSVAPTEDLIYAKKPHMGRMSFRS